MNKIDGNCTFTLTKHEGWKAKKVEADRWKDKYDKLVDAEGTLWEWSKASCSFNWKIQGKKGSGKYSPTSDLY